MTGDQKMTIPAPGIYNGYGGIIIAPPWGLGWGVGIYVDGAGNAYPQLYYGIPGYSSTWGYAQNVGEFLTGTSISGIYPGGGIKYSLGGNTFGPAVGAGFGTPGIGVTYGFGPYNIPDYLKPYLPNPRDPLVLDLTGTGIQLSD